MSEHESDERSDRSWWHTLPGVLTAIAGLITAVTGLILGVAQIWPDSEDEAGGQTAVTIEQSATTQVPESGRATDYVVSFPGGTRATLADVEAVYEITDTRVERRNPGELALALEIKLTNNGRFDENFWSRSFRLDAGGETSAPIDDLNELVAGGTTKRGTVTFAVPESTRKANLIVGEPGNENVTLPLALRPA